MTPNPLATIMLLIWPFLVALIFTRMERVNAAVWSLLAGYMFLPPNFYIDLPVVPAVGKYEVASVSTLLMLWLGLGRKGIERDAIVDLIAPSQPERDESLKLRFDNEFSLLESARARPFSAWGAVGATFRWSSFQTAR